MGNLQNNLVLSNFSLTSINTNNAVIKAMIDNILSSLRLQKVAGGAIATINLTNTPAPTNGTSNTDYQFLIANGVTVTLGTL